MIEHVDALHHLCQDGLDLDQALVAARAGLGDLEHARLGLVEQLPHILAHRVQSGIGDAGAHFDQLPLDGALAHDLGVTPDVVRRWRVLRQRSQIGQPAGLVLVLALLDRLEHRDHVGGPVLLHQLADVAVDAPMVVAVEIAFRENVGDALPGLVVEQQTAQHRLLRLDRMRRDPQLHQLRIVHDLRVWLGHGEHFVGMQILLQDVPVFIHNRVFGADTLFIRTKNRVGAQSAQFTPGDIGAHSRIRRTAAPELARTASRPRGSPIAHGR